MPYHIVRAPGTERYFVAKDTGKRFSKAPLPRDVAMAQLRALYASEARRHKNIYGK